MTETEQTEARSATRLAQWPTGARSMLCANCDTIYAYGRLCAHCGSENTLNLAAILAGKGVN